MFEWRDFLLVEGGPDRDRKVAGGIQHQAAALVAGLQAASTGGLYSSHATKLKFTGPSCDVNSLIRRGTKTRAGQIDTNPAEGSRNGSSRPICFDILYLVRFKILLRALGDFCSTPNSNSA